MSAWLFWVILAAILIGIEVMTQWVWTFCLAVGCIGALVAIAFEASVPVQTGIVAITSVAAYFACVPFMKRWFARARKQGGESSRTGMDALLGRKAEVIEEIRPGELGRVRIDGDRWQVRAPGFNTIIPRGAIVSVTGYDSIILTVHLLTETN